MKTIYIIDYTVHFKPAGHKSGTMKVKNQSSQFVAQINLELFLKRKYKDFDYLVIHNVKEDNGLQSLLNSLGITR